MVALAAIDRQLLCDFQHAVVHQVVQKGGFSLGSHSPFLQTCWLQMNDEDYKNALAAIVLDIQKQQTRLSEIRSHERRAMLLTTIYALVVWVVYVTV